MIYDANFARRFGNSYYPGVLALEKYLYEGAKVSGYKCSSPVSSRLERFHTMLMRL